MLGTENAAPSGLGLVMPRRRLHHHLRRPGRGSPLGFHSGCFKKEAEERRVVTRQTDRQEPTATDTAAMLGLAVSMVLYCVYFGVMEFVAIWFFSGGRAI